MNKNGFQVTHLTEKQKEKTQSISLTQRESSAKPNIVFSVISGSEKEVRKAWPKSPRTSTLPTSLWVETLLGLDLGGAISDHSE